MSESHTHTATEWLTGNERRKIEGDPVLSINDVVEYRKRKAMEVGR